MIGGHWLFPFRKSMHHSGEFAYRHCSIFGTLLSFGKVGFRASQNQYRNAESQQGSRNGYFKAITSIIVFIPRDCIFKPICAIAECAARRYDMFITTARNKEDLQYIIMYTLTRPVDIYHGRINNHSSAKRYGQPAQE